MASMFFFLQTFEFYWEIFESGPSEHRPASSSSAYLYIVQPKRRRKQRGTYEGHAALLVCESVYFFPVVFNTQLIHVFITRDSVQSTATRLLYALEGLVASVAVA